MGGRASKSVASPSQPPQQPPQRSGIRCRVSTWARFVQARGGRAGAVAYDAQLDRVLVAVAHGDAPRPTCIVAYRFPPGSSGSSGDGDDNGDGDNDGDDDDNDNDDGDDDTSDGDTSGGDNHQVFCTYVLDARWRVRREFNGFALVPPRRAHAYSSPSATTPVSSVSWSADAVIVHDAEQFFRVHQSGTSVCLSRHLRDPQGIAAMAVDSRGHLAHVERNASIADFDILWLHKVGRLGSSDADDDSSSCITRSERIAPPRVVPATNDAIRVDENGHSRAKWMGLVAVAFDADDRVYVLDRGCATGCARLYQSRAPLAEPIRTESLTPSPMPPVGLLRWPDAEVPCAWNLVADLSVMFAHAQYDRRKEEVFLAVDAFRRRVYIAHATCVYVVHLVGDGSSDDNGKLGSSGGGGGQRSSSTGGGCDSDETMRLAPGRFELLVGWPNQHGNTDGDSAQALFAGITGCTIRTRAVDRVRDVAPVTEAIRDATGKGNGMRWPPGVAEIVEAYARGTGRPAESLVLSDCDGLCLRRIALL